ncbi:MAG: NAAT family transporter [Flavobacteriales bacterium]|jgi:multiple antibiotic resistance protein|nr:NAAT family transporter [Flavobacteriales bacterium]
MNSELLAYFILVLTSYFTIMNPLGTMPVFMTMTAGLTSQQRRKTAFKAVIVAFVAVIFFALTGQMVFQFFGISVNSLRIVGGIIFFQIGTDMLQARLAKSKVDESEVKKYIDDISVTPLGIPMICGPAAITNSIILTQDATGPVMQLLHVTGVAVILLFVFVILWSSGRILRVLGETGNKVLMRIMGLIVMVIAIELLVAGAKPIILDILRAV